MKKDMGKKIFSLEHRRKLSLAHLGKKQSKETIEKRVSKLRGKPRCLEVRKKISQSLKKSQSSKKTQFKKGHVVPLEWKISMSKIMKIKSKHREITSYRRGFTLSPETKEKISKSLGGRDVGAKGSNWQGGITILNRLIRSRFQYLKWRRFCLFRDKLTCQTCSAQYCELHVHHITSFSTILKKNNITDIGEAVLCKELWDTDNGVTLCLDCHKKTDNYLNVQNRKKEVEHEYF